MRLDVLLTTLTVVVVVAVTAEDVPSSVVSSSINDVDEDVEATVAEVTRRLNADPSLPRLSRPQILAILKEIREKEDDKGRALMVVLPHSVNNASDEAMADLFTKPPVTAMEDIGSAVTVAYTTPTTSRRRPTVAYTEEDPYLNHRQPIYTQETTSTITTEQPIPSSSIFTSSQSPWSDVVTASGDDKPSKEHVSFSSHKVALKKPLPPNSGVPLRRKRPTTYKPPVEVVSSPSSPDDQVMFHVQKPLLQGIPANHKPSSDAHSSLTLHSKRRPLRPPTNTAPADNNQLYPSYVTKGPVLEALSINQGLFLPTPVSQGAQRPFTAPATTTTTTTTTTSAPLAEGVPASAVDALSPEMKDLLASLGILPGSNTAAATSLLLKTTPPPPQPSYDPQHFQRFRPLPLAASPHVEGDMHQLLSEFGLLTPGPGVDASRSRDHKAFNAADMLPEDMRDVLANLGLLESDQRGGEHRKQRLLDANLTAAASEHVFNPLAINATEEDRGRVAQLLDSVRQFHNLSDDQGPDPLSPDQLDVDPDETKNEVKRQNEANVTSDVVVLIGNHTVGATNGSSEDSKKAQQQALAESFGGDGDDYDAAVGEEVVQAPRPNGLYFLVDWNSFLEVGEEGKNKVNIRIAPKVGDSRNFLPVTIP